MTWHGDVLPALAALGVVAAIVGLAYFVYRGLASDHETGEYEFTWGVAVVVLFLLGFGPGLVGVGLYLVVERGYPAHYAWIAIVLALLVLGVVGYAFATAELVVESEAAAAALRSPTAAWA